jgi:hypothetical protein
MAEIKIGLVVDHRVGVFMVLTGTMLKNRTQWRIGYLGEYGFEGDPQPHEEFFGTLAKAMDRWKELVEGYHSRCLSIDRLKAFKKDWIPSFDGRSENDEASLFFKDVGLAVLTSQGERSRRKRIWWFVSEWSGSVEPFGNWSKALIPAELLKPGKPLEPATEAVPIRAMSKRLNAVWDVILKVYRERL